MKVQLRENNLYMASGTDSDQIPAAQGAPPATQAASKDEGPQLFHFAECTSCHHLLPISTTTEKYYAILAKEPNRAFGLGEKCARCGSDSWKIVKV